MLSLSFLEFLLNFFERHRGIRKTKVLSALKACTRVDEIHSGALTDRVHTTNIILRLAVPPGRSCLEILEGLL